VEAKRKIERISQRILIDRKTERERGRKKERKRGREREGDIGREKR
jgi:hypothetical protein